MPRYKKKITRQMGYKEFNGKIKNYRNPLTGKPLSLQRKAYLTVLFFAGFRVSEVLALTSDDISCNYDIIFVQVFRLKGSQQTDPTEIPRTDALEWLCSQEGKLFSFSRTTAWRIVKAVFPELYPHFFRQNRFTDVADKFPLATVVSFSGLNPLSVKHYLAKVAIKKVGEDLRKEISS